MLNSDGAAVIRNGQIDRIGKTPAESEIDDLVLWLQSQEQNDVFTRSSLSAVYEPAEEFAGVASGVIVLPLQPETKTYILGFRPEAIDKVDWGGDPSGAITFEPDGKTYHPRASFGIWQQSVTKTSVPWNEEELKAAENFRNSLREFILSRS